MPLADNELLNPWGDDLPMMVDHTLTAARTQGTPANRADAVIAMRGMGAASTTYHAIAARTLPVILFRVGRSHDCDCEWGVSCLFFVPRLIIIRGVIPSWSWCSIRCSGFPLKNTGKKVRPPTPYGNPRTMCYLPV